MYYLPPGCGVLCCVLNMGKMIFTFVAYELYRNVKDYTDMIMLLLSFPFRISGYLVFTQYECLV